LLPIPLFIIGSNPIAPTTPQCEASSNPVGFPTEKVLGALVAKPVLGSKQSKPQTREFGAGATPFALALSRVNDVFGRIEIQEHLGQQISH
jgi:hypothetical protein